jgi:hypothetical protein
MCQKVFACSRLAKYIAQADPLDRGRMTFGQRFTNSAT